MCRLYGFHANEPTRVECSLVHSQNALLEQGIRDSHGLSHGHGWGVAVYPDGVPRIEKQAWAAWHGEHFKNAARRVYAKTTIAHVRRATVGPPNLRNTHPFAHGRWVFAHNGTIPKFDLVRPHILEAMDSLNRQEMHGSTDSEHVFRYLLTLWGKEPERSPMELLREAIQQIVVWTREIDRDLTPSLNVLWSDGEHLIGSRLNRTLWFLERDCLFYCEICGKPHVLHNPKQEYRSVEVASEPITSERWLSVPNASVFTVGADMRIHFEALGIPMIDDELVQNAANAPV